MQEQFSRTANLGCETISSPHFARVNEHRRQSFERLKKDFTAAAPEVQKSIEMAFSRWKEKKSATAPDKS